MLTFAKNITKSTRKKRRKTNKSKSGGTTLKRVAVRIYENFAVTFQLHRLQACAEGDCGGGTG
jgi:hypothetical protein